MTDQNSHIRRAAEIVGSSRILAGQLKVTPSMVSQWISGHRPVSVTHMAQIEHLTNGAVSRRMLRPDDWMLIWPELASQKPMYNSAIAVAGEI